MGCTSSTGRKSPEEPIQPQELFLQYFMSKSTNMTAREVVNACDRYSAKSLELMVSSENDTVLHIASRLKKEHLVLELLKIVPEEWNDRLADATNNSGNNILHEVVVGDSMKKVAGEMLKRAPALLTARNKLGETPIFCAASYGQLEMFKFLDEKMKEMGQTEADRIGYLKRNYGTTALHSSTDTECFELACYIAKRYSDLIEEKDQDSMTALQLLACNPTAFKKNEIKGGQEFMEQLIMSSSAAKLMFGVLISVWKEFSSSSKESKSKQENNLTTAGKRGLTLQDLVKLLIKKDTSCSPLQELVKLLIKKDTSCYENESHHERTLDREQDYQNTSTNIKHKKSDVAPLLLATISNIEDIIKETITQHPEALRCTNKKGQNILHLAILYRHYDIYKMVIKEEIFARSLLSAVDNEGNSILHMFGITEGSESSRKMQNPAYQLWTDLQLFKEVKSACKKHLTKRLNNDNLTAEALFVNKNEKLHEDAKEWVMRASENCTILSVFIATVAFAATYTLPGGPNQGTGIPILRSKPCFVLFLVADVISLTLALNSVVIFLSILTSTFPLRGFETNLFRKLKWGMMSMIFSVSIMAVSFGATIMLIWENAAWSVVGFLPGPISFLSYPPLRSIVIKSFVMFIMVVIWMVLYLFSLSLVILFLPFFCIIYPFMALVSWIRGTPEPTTTSAIQHDV